MRPSFFCPSARPQWKNWKKPDAFTRTTTTLPWEVRTFVAILLSYLHFVSFFPNASFSKETFSSSFFFFLNSSCPYLLSSTSPSLLLFYLLSSPTFSSSSPSFSHSSFLFLFSLSPLLFPTPPPPSFPPSSSSSSSSSSPPGMLVLDKGELRWPNPNPYTPPVGTPSPPPTVEVVKAEVGKWENTINPSVLKLSWHLLYWSLWY